MEPIRLNKDEFETIKSKYKNIGCGVDGSIYKIDNKTIYKIYHDNRNLINIRNPIIDEEGVILNDFKSLRKYNTNYIENINYTDKDGVILTREDAIYKAIEKQKNVHMTDLPQNIIYVDNQIVGCEYKYYNHKLGIYAAAYLPFKQRLIICKKILEKVNELLDNNIYPVTLAQRSDVFPFKSDGSNVLIGFNLEPIIIDLDGISAMYSDVFSEKYYKRVLSSLSTLILEILSRVELADTIEDDEMVINELIERMVRNNIPYLISKKYFDYFSLDFDDINQIIKTLEKTIK